MKPKTPLVYFVAVLIAFFLVGTIARATTIEIIQTFDVVGEGTSTLPQKISDQIDIVGTTIAANGNVKAFLYKVRKQKFSLPIAAPYDTGNFTQGRGINNKRRICGEYLNGADGTYHGYLMISGPMNTLMFSQYDLATALETVPLGENNFNSLVGTALMGDGSQLAFVNIGKTVTTFGVPDATATFAYQLNGANEIVGYYIDVDGFAHGYTRDSIGNLTYPIDAPGATETLLLGNNDSNWAVGKYMDASGAVHGLFYITPDDILTYDYPDATYTSLNGINKDGLICGYYGDAAGLSHGFVAQVNLTASGKPHTNDWAIPFKPAYVLPELLRGQTPSL